MEEFEENKTMTKKTERIRKDIKSLEEKLKAKTNVTTKKKQKNYELKKEADLLEQNAKRKENLNTFRTLLNKSDKHAAIKDLYKNEDARIGEYVTEKMADFDRCDNFADFKEFLKEFFTDAIVLTEEFDKNKVTEQIRQCEERNKIITDVKALL